MPRELAPGEEVLLIDPEGKSHVIRLAERDLLHHRFGVVRHSDVIGLCEGDWLRSSLGKPFAVVRPRLTDHVFSMPRQTGIVYPKDSALMIQMADVRPGLRVLESGVGSGALSLALLRAVGENGVVIGYERRSDFVDLAIRNVQAFTGGPAGNLLVRERDTYDGIVDGDLDRAMLDLAEPWRVLPALSTKLRPGGWVCAYTPSIVQAARFTEALRLADRYTQIETVEILVRPWHIEGAAVRPVQQMVGHTGFITVGRLLASRSSLSQPDNVASV